MIIVKIIITIPPLIWILSLHRIDNVTQINIDSIATFPEKLNLKRYIDKDIGFSDN